MPSGHADWRPPGLGAGSRLYVFVFTTVFPQDIIASPGAGFRIVLYHVTVIANGVATFELHEETSGNVDVRRLYRHTYATADAVDQLYFDGVPFAPNNKLRTEVASGPGVAVTYTVEPI